MQLKLSVESDLLKLIPKLNALDPRQAKFAIASALTKTAKQAQEAIRDEMRTSFKSPTSYTLNSLYLKPATKSSLQAEIRVKDKSSGGNAPIKPLSAEIYSGQRQAKGVEVALRAMGILPPNMFVVPGAGAPLDANGNINGRFIRSMLDALRSEPVARGARRSKGAQGAATFFAVTGADKGRLPLGIYARYGFAQGSAVKPILIFVGAPQYRQRMTFFETGNKVINDRLLGNLGEAYETTVATAKA